MIKLKTIKDYFKDNFEWDGKISIGKLNRDDEKSICFYQSNRRKKKIFISGGDVNKTYDVKPISIYIRYTKNQDTAEDKTLDIYNFFNDSSFTLDNEVYFIQMIYEEAMSQGTDQSGVYEYIIELDCYKNKN